MSRGKTLPEFVNLRTALPAPRPSRAVGKEVLPNAVPKALGASREERKEEPIPEEAFLECETFGLARLRGLGMQERTFAVVIPTWNREKTLKWALNSLVGQRYARWVALVLDDGSTDETSALVHTMMQEEPRIHYVRYPKRRGGVAMNERGMSLAIEAASWWSRLGSDDRWGVSKLDHDAIALGSCPFEACYGSYRLQRGTELGASFNRSHTSTETKNLLLAGKFGVSWANVACATSVLAKVKKQYGRFAHSDLVNMEDFLVNARIARFTDWVWRGVVGGKLVVNPKEEGLVSDELEAVWNDCLTGASGDERQRDRDFARTLELIAND
jgi:hypothetical protein